MDNILEGGEGTPPDSGTPPADPGSESNPPASPPPGEGNPAGDAGTALATEGFFNKLPDNWRTQLANGDDKRLNQLERVSDMGTFVDNYFNAQDKIRSGEISNGLPENPTEEQLNDWRVANGIPEAPEGYQLTYDEGIVLGDADKRIIESLYPVAHANNIPVEALNNLANAFLNGRLDEFDAVASEDGVHKQTAIRQLKDTWGGDYDTNVNLIKGMTARLPESVRELFADARLGDGRPVFSSPEMMVFFADIERQLNPLGTVVPDSPNQVKAIEDEIAELEARMGTDEWYKDEKANARYTDLVNALEQHNAQYS